MTAFSATGFKILEADSSKLKNLRDVVFDSEDRMVSSGICYGLMGHDICMIRYDASGNLDTSFANNGYLLWDHSYAPVNAANSVKEYAAQILYDSGFYYAITGIDSGSVPGLLESQTGTILKVRESDGNIVDTVLNIPCKIKALDTTNDAIYYSGYKLPEDDFCWGKINKANFQLDLDYGADHDLFLDTSLTDVRNRSYNLTVTNQNEAYVCGNASLNATDGKMLKIKSDGTLDTDFGNSGIMTFSDLYGVESTSENRLSPIPLPNNQLLVFGYSETEINGTQYYRIFTNMLD